MRDDSLAASIAIDKVSSDGTTTDASSNMVSDPEGLDAARIEPPQPLPIDRRGGSALAFGVLRARMSVAPGLGETEQETLAANADDARTDDGTSEELPAKPDLLLIDGGLGQLGVAQEVIGTSASRAWR